MKVKLVGDIDPMSVELLCVPRVGELVELSMWEKRVEYVWSTKRFKVAAVQHRVIGPDRFDQSIDQSHAVEIVVRKMKAEEL